MNISLISQIRAMGAAIVFCFVADGIIEAATVTLTASDGEGFSSFESGENWSDGQAPRAGNEYVVERELLRLPKSGGPHVFAGDSLTLNSTFMYVEEGAEGTEPYELSVAHLIMNMAQIHVSRNGGAVLHGKLELFGNENFLVAGLTDNPRPLTITSTLTGVAELKLLSASTESYIRVVANDITDFAGGIHFLGGGFVDILGNGAFGGALSFMFEDGTLVRVGGGGTTHDYLPDFALLIFTSGESLLELDYNGIDEVGEIFVKDTGFLAPGLYGAVGNPLAEFTSPNLRGSGLLRVVPEPGMVAMLWISLGIAAFRRRR